MVNYKCFGKEEFKSYALALKVTKRVNRRTQGGQAGRQAYRCFSHIEPTWHIGNNFLRKERKLFGSHK